MKPVEELTLLKAKDLFGPNGFLYAGVLDEELKERLKCQFSQVLDKFILAATEDWPPEDMLNLLKVELTSFNREVLDTEDAENLAGNFEKIMDCIGLDSSGGALNDWMYGFDPS